MKHNPEELKKAQKLYSENFNSLPFELRKSLASPHDRILENEIAITLAEKHLANLKQRRRNLQDWLMDWYHNQTLEEQK